MKYGKKVEAALHFWEQLKVMKTGQTIALASINETKIFRLEEVRTNPNGRKSYATWIDEATAHRLGAGMKKIAPQNSKEVATADDNRTKRIRND